MIPYIVTVGLVLTCCLAFYQLLLKKETFYKANRYMLLICMVIAFALPFIHMPQQFSLRKAGTVAMDVNTVSPVSDVATNQSTGLNTFRSTQNDKSEPGAGNTSSPKLMQWLLWLYWFGVIVFGVNFLVQIVMLLFRAYSNPVIKDRRFRIVEVKDDKAPCSFANNIFINPEKYDWEIYNQIIQHEKIHIQQNHTLDIVLAELVLTLQWFNPFAWIYRREVESNLEFLTDDQLVQKENIEKSGYQVSLLKVSAPHLPLSVTTNYNQSLLKKRITMMNTKRSSVHTAWKYFFLLPLFVILASMLNEPAVRAQYHKETANRKTENRHNFQREGYWFAVIKGDKINMRFTQSDDDHDSYSGSDFQVSDFSNLPRGTNGDFSLTREAGTMNFNGKFEGDQGMGRYTFQPNKDFQNYLTSQGLRTIDDNDMAAFFFVNVTKEYWHMLKDEGFSDIKKENLIALRALKVDKDFISSIKAEGYNDIGPDKLTALKALGVDGAYIKEIKSAGVKDISLDQIISFKAQGINKEYLSKLPKNVKGQPLSADNVVQLKAMNVDEAYANSFKALGYDDLSPDQLISMKSDGVTPGYVKEFQALGYKDIPADQFVVMKSQGITPQFVKEFEDVGFKNIAIDHLISLKAMGIKAAFIQSFKKAGYNNISLNQAVSLKSQNVTPEFVNEFAKVGYKNISLDNALALKATGVTPAWIKDMKAKGFNYDDVTKYIALKSLK